MKRYNKDIITDIPIELSPKLPQGIIDAYERRELVIFIGAGISRLMGCQGWDDMANNLIRNIFDFATAEQIISSRMSSKDKITVAKRYAEKDPQKEKVFWKTFRKSLKTNGKNADIYDLISQLQILYITTNCDGLLVKRYPRSFTTKCTISEYDKHKSMPYVFCIHGNYGKGNKADKETLVFTVDDYLKKYQPSNDLPVFLRNILNNNTVLFLGYGLSEFEILSAAFNPDSSGERKHYLLEGFFIYQQELCNAYAEYYKSLQINLIAYSKDVREYQQQYIVIKEWIEELKNKTSYNSRGVQLLASAMESFTQEDQETILRGVNRSDGLNYSYRIAILDELPKTPVCFKWIHFFITNGIISVNDIPRVKHIENGYQFSKSNVLLAIIACLNQYRPNSEEKQVLIKFINECIELASDDEDILLNKLVISDLVEIFLLLDMIPKNNACIVWKRWACSSDYSIVLLEKYEKQIFEWPEDILFSLMKWLFSPGEEKYREHRSYYFDNIIDILLRRNLQQLMIPLINYLLDCLKENYDGLGINLGYNSFDDRYHIIRPDYSFAIISSVKRLFEYVEICDRITVLSKLFQYAVTSYDYQNALYFARYANVDAVLNYVTNPLNIYGTFVDFYYLLEHVINNKNRVYNEEKIAEIVEWIKNATFGMEYDDSDDNEWTLVRKKKINTWKYQLYEQITKLDDQYTYCLKSIQPEDILNIKTPKEDREQYYSVRTFFSDGRKNVESINLAGLSGYEILSSIEEIYSKDPHTDYYDRRVICEEIINRLSNEQLESFLLASNSWNSEKLSSITASLSKPNIIKRVRKEVFEQLIQILITRIYSEDFSESRSRLISHLIDIYQIINECGWDNEFVLNAIISLDLNNLFKIVEKYNNDMGIIMNIINVSESRLIQLAIKTSVYVKANKNIIILFKDWIEKSVIARWSIWDAYSCAYGIQNLMHIDRKWSNEIIFSKLDKFDNPNAVAICMCNGTTVVFPEIIRFITKNNTIEDICNWTGNNDSIYRDIDSFITYLIVAKYYEILAQVDYIRFINNINDRDVNHLVWSVLCGTRDAEIEKMLNLLKDTYEIYKQNHEVLGYCKSVLVYSSRVDDKINENLWCFIKTMTQVAIQETRIWELINDCIENTETGCGYISEIVQLICKFSDKPNDYSLKQMMYRLASINMLEDVRYLARYAISKGISPLEMSKYDDFPEKVLMDFELYR